jgi:hypothetical protein
VKVSEIEKLTGTAGIRNVAEPPMSVRPARTKNAAVGGCCAMLQAEKARTPAPTAVTTQM